MPISSHCFCPCDSAPAFQSGVVHVNRRRLEFAPDAEAIDLVFVQLGEVGVPAEFDPALVRFGAAGDQVEHGAFAGAVRADDHAQLAFVHVEVEFGNGFEAVEGLVHAFEGEDEFFGVGKAHVVAGKTFNAQHSTFNVQCGKLSRH
jgi:hypothetical protein